MPKRYSLQAASVPARSVPVTVIVLTRDEEVNIAHALSSAAWAAQLVVVDSGSTDRTVHVARAAGATVVETHWRGFGAQREFALRMPEVEHDWVYFLDADEWVSDELAAAIVSAVASGQHDAYWQYVRLVFQGRWIRHCGWYPSARRVHLMRRDRARFPDESLSEYPVIDGTVGRLSADLVDEDRKGLAAWLHKHVHYAELEAARRAARATTPTRRLPHERRIRILLKDVVAPRVPARPLVTFLYMYVLRAGFLDGRQGLLFCLLHAWFQRVVLALGGEAAKAPGVPGGNRATHPAMERRRPVVGLVAQVFEGRGGVQTVARWFAEELPRHGFDVVIFELAFSARDAGSRRILGPTTWTNRLVSPADTGSQVWKVGANAVELEPFRYLPRRELTARLRSCDVLQVVAGTPAVALVTRRAERPTFVHMATLVSQERPSVVRESGMLRKCWGRATMEAVTRMERTALRSAQRTYVMSPDMQRHLAACGIDTDLAPPGVDTERFHPTAPWSPGGYVLSVGRLSESRKGYERMVQALAFLRDQLEPSPRLVLGGAGVLGIGVTRLAQELGVDHLLDVRPDVSSEELVGLYRGASVYWTTSFEEGLGLSLIEALACGVPVVATETAGTNITVADDVGVLVSQTGEVSREVARATVRILKGEGARMSVAARTRAVQRFSSEAAIVPFVEAYREALDIVPGSSA